MIWSRSDRFDPKARDLADRHYNRQKPGTDQFVPPGRCLVLFAATETGRAFWVTSWPFAEYVKHAWPGAWVCSAFRNEGAGLSSDLIRQAVAATRAYMGVPPPYGHGDIREQGQGPRQAGLRLLLSDGRLSAVRGNKGRASGIAVAAGADAGAGTSPWLLVVMTLSLPK